MHQFILFSLLVVATFADPNEGDCQLNGDCAVLWQNDRCLGQRLGINPTNGNVGNGFNDKASSGFVSQGCHLTVFDDDNFGGDSRTFLGGYFTMGDFNDRTTSARCSCP